MSTPATRPLHTPLSTETLVELYTAPTSLSTIYTPPGRPTTLAQYLVALFFAVMAFYASDAGRCVTMSSPLVVMLHRMQDVARHADSERQKNALGAALDFLATDKAIHDRGVAEVFTMARQYLAVFIDAEVEASLASSQRVWHDDFERETGGHRHV